MISRAQFQQRVGQATTALKALFPTSITIDGSDPIGATRWGQRGSVDPELAGVLASYDIAFRVERSLLTGITLRKRKSIVRENDTTSYVLEDVLDGNGDDCLVLQCKAT